MAGMHFNPIVDTPAWHSCFSARHDHLHRVDFQYVNRLRNAPVSGMQSWVFSTTPTGQWLYDYLEYTTPATENPVSTAPPTTGQLWPRWTQQ